VATGVVSFTFTGEQRNIRIANRRWFSQPHSYSTNTKMTSWIKQTAKTGNAYG